MKVLVVDVGGTHVKILASGQQTVRKFRSGPALTPKQMLAGVLKASKGWAYETVSIGYPGPVLHGEVYAEPKHLGPGWVGFDFKTAFGCPVRVINDAAMQALGGYEGGRMLFLGLGTGLGSALIADKVIMPMELAHLPYKKGGTFEDYVGRRGLERLGKKKWRRTVEDVVVRLKSALVADDVLLGGGNAKKLKRLPEGVRLGGNAHAFLGGQRLWEETARSPQ
ncbi:MAG: Polyphosphate glucokinase [Nitrospira sp.]|jgi:predicted NBD/HSP70 family sugar kinase|nr:MAG: Polyphosphate glucokinase [Nitrospira sp.]